jgi:hypothetical protein
MQAGWLKAETRGFKNGVGCPSISATTSAASGYLFVGFQNNCGGAGGPNIFRTQFRATVWDKLNTGVWGNLAMGPDVVSPDQAF